MPAMHTTAGPPRHGAATAIHARLPPLGIELDIAAGRAAASGLISLCLHLLAAGRTDVGLGSAPVRLGARIGIGRAAGAAGAGTNRRAARCAAARADLGESYGGCERERAGEQCGLIVVHRNSSWIL